MYYCFAYRFASGSGDDAVPLLAHDGYTRPRKNILCGYETCPPTFVDVLQTDSARAYLVCTS